MRASRWASLATLLAGPLLAAVALAQVPPARVSFVANADDASTRALVDAFRAGLSDLGQVEGRSYVLDIAYGRATEDHRGRA